MGTVCACVLICLQAWGHTDWWGGDAVAEKGGTDLHCDKGCLKYGSHGAVGWPAVTSNTSDGVRPALVLVEPGGVAWRPWHRLAGCVGRLLRGAGWLALAYGVGPGAV